MLPAKALSLISSYLTTTTSSPSPPSTQEQTCFANQNQKLCGIIFSKDRPGQLLCCIESLLNNNPHQLDVIYIIWLSTNSVSENNYLETFSRLLRRNSLERDVQAEITTVIKPIRQENTTSSHQSFYNILHSIIKDETFDFIYFQVDDAIYYSDSRKILTKGMELLSHHENVLGIHTKLWRNCTRCQPANNVKIVRPPIINSLHDFCLFQRQDGTYDWNYPFDLSGGLYRRRDVFNLIQTIDPTKCTSPNKLEVLGNESGWIGFGSMPFSACPDRLTPILSLITINRVQSDYLNPIYDCPKPFDQFEPYGILTEQLFKTGLDLEKYAAASVDYDACHIGDLFLGHEPICPSGIDVSVLIPCRNSEKTLAIAIQSVLDQDITPYRMELVIVDDASEDASAFIARRFNSKPDKQIRVLLRRKNQGGLKSCLDFGLKHCRSDLICRMDADDVCLTGRIKSQLDVMKQRLSVAVLGTATRIIMSNGQIRMAPTPVGKCSVAWSMFFYCSLVHPSVCFRKQPIQNLGCYTEAVSNSLVDSEMEDYCLWLRLIEQKRWDLDNLPLVGMDYYKNTKSITGLWSKSESALKQSRISLLYAQKRAPSLRKLNVTLWQFVCNPKRSSTNKLLPEEKQIIKAGLIELKLSLVTEYQSISSKDDLDFVESDCQARLLEIDLS
jgi:glycosyltransferase involved in cell wall biosynthesis